MSVSWITSGQGGKLSVGVLMRNEKYKQLPAKILKWAGEIRSWGIAWKTGIYPGEMAAFLGLCDLLDMKSIIESGRGEHAYSTHVLGEYAERMKTIVVSIDFNPLPGNAVGQSLKGYRNLRCVVGDAFTVLPKVLGTLAGPIALLLDGPKLEPANRLSLVASVMVDVKVVAHHNCPLDAVWGKEFAQMFPGAFHYEHLGLSELPEWQQFKEWEAEWVKHYDVYDEVHKTRGRSLEASSLAIATVSPDMRSKRRLLELQGGPLRYHPLWLWLKWSFPRRKLRAA